MGPGKQRWGVGLEGGVGEGEFKRGRNTKPLFSLFGVSGMKTERPFHGCFSVKEPVTHPTENPLRLSFPSCIIPVKCYSMYTYIHVALRLNTAPIQKYLFGNNKSAT